MEDSNIILFILLLGALITLAIWLWESKIITRLVKSMIKTFYKMRIVSLKKKLKTHPKNYYKLRLRAEKFISYSKTQYVCKCIALYAHEHPKFYPDVNDIFVIGDDIYIYTYRPGIWIGKYGNTIEEILGYINTDAEGKKVMDMKINFIEVASNTATAFLRYALASSNEY